MGEFHLAAPNRCLLLFKTGMCGLEDGVMVRVLAALALGSQHPHGAAFSLGAVTPVPGQLTASGLLGTCTCVCIYRHTYKTQIKTKILMVVYMWYVENFYF